MSITYDPRTTSDAVGGDLAHRSRAWIGVSAAILGFTATTLVWRLGHRVAAIDDAVQAVASACDRTAAETDARLRRIDERLTAQANATDRLAEAIASIDQMARQTQTTLASIDHHAQRGAEAAGDSGRQLAELATDVARFRHEIDTRLAGQHDATVAGREELVRAVEASIASIEGVVLRQADELRQRQDGMNEAAARMRTRQQRVLGEATEAIATQLDGLRQIVDALRDENLPGMGEATARHPGSEGESPLTDPPADGETAAAAATNPTPDTTAEEPTDEASETPVAEVAEEPRDAVSK